MTLLFKDKHVPYILRRAWPWKTATRRRWKGKVRVKVGGIYWLSTHLYKKDKRFARALVTDVYDERFAQTKRISEGDARAEGYLSRREYLKSFKEITGLPKDNEPITVVEFVPVGKDSARGCIQCPECGVFQDDEDGIVFDATQHFCQGCGHSFSGEEPCPCHPHPKEEET